MRLKFAVFGSVSSDLEHFMSYRPFDILRKEAPSTIRHLNVRNNLMKPYHTNK